MILAKLIKIFCIIEEKACNNSNCPEDKRCDERCVAPAEAISSTSAAGPSTLSSSSPSTTTPNSTPPPSPTLPVRGLRLIPAAMRKTMHSFGFGEGHYQMFVEEKQRQQYISKSRLNAAVAEAKLNPN